MLLLRTRQSGTARLMLCVASSLLFHWLFVLLFQATGEPSHYRISADSRINIFLNQRGQGINKPRVLDSQSVRSAQVRSASKEAATSSNELPVFEPASDLYADPKDVDQVAFALDVPVLPLPTDERISSGMLRAKVLIDQNGKPDGIEVLETTFPEDYVSSLVRTFSQGVFRPAMLSGKPVKSWRLIDISFGDMEAEDNRSTELGK